MIYNMTYNKWTTYNTTLLQAKLSCKHAYVYAETLTTSEHWTTYNTTLLQAFPSQSGQKRTLCYFTLSNARRLTEPCPSLFLKLLVFLHLINLVWWPWSDWRSDRQLLRPSSSSVLAQVLVFWKQNTFSPPRQKTSRLVSRGLRRQWTRFTHTWRFYF